MAKLLVIPETDLCDDEQQLLLIYRRLLHFSSHTLLLQEATMTEEKKIPNGPNNEYSTSLVDKVSNLKTMPLIFVSLQNVDVS